jgi:ABC-type sugar transport system ATPase subunit
MRTELIKLHRQLGRTIVHVTHDQVEAMTMGERICIMKDGRVVQVGPPLEVYRNPADTFVAGFLASPPMNLLRSRVEADAAGMLAAVHGALRVTIPPGCDAARFSGGPVVLGIRPEDLYDHPIADGVAVDLRVVALEALGPETVLVAEIPGGAEISARLGRAFTAAVGANQRLYLDPGQIHLFDPATSLAVPRYRPAERSRRAGP